MTIEERVDRIIYDLPGNYGNSLSINDIESHLIADAINQQITEAIAEHNEACAQVADDRVNFCEERGKHPRLHETEMACAGEGQIIARKIRALLKPAE